MCTNNAFNDALYKHCNFRVDTEVPERATVTCTKGNQKLDDQNDSVKEC